jgi:predicted  nucleic acid-binding Zn-ribbon protein
MTTSLIQYSIDAVTLLGIFAYGLSQFYRGKTDKTKDEYATENTLIEYLKKQVEGFKEITKDQNDKLQQMGKDIAALTAVVNEKQKTIDNQLAILQNRNPELESFMTDLRSAAVEQRDYRTSSTATFGQMVVLLGEISAQLPREIKISSTVTQ